MMRFALVLLLVSVASLPAVAQTTYESYTGWSVSTTPVLPASEAHPQLWFDADGLTAMRAKWADPAYADVVARVRDDVSDYKRRNASSTDPGDRSQMAKALAFAWIIDGDQVAMVRGMQALLLAYQNVPREATTAAFSGDNDEIYRATWLQNFCDAYDWLQPMLTPDNDALVRAALAEEAGLLADNMVSGVRYAPRPHNHRSKPAYALGTAALTLSDHPDAADWLQLALEQQNTTTRYQFSADGVYREGSHYWVYTMVNAIPFLWQYRHAGVDLFPAYQPTFEWVVRTRTGRGWMPALEDGFPKPAPTHMVAAAYASSPTLLHPTAPLANVLQWNWDTTDFFRDDYTGATRDVVWTIEEFLTVDASLDATAPGVSPTQALDSGQIVFRSDWNAGDPDTRTVLFHGVASADNHDHPDLMSVMIDAQNTPLAVDAGYGPGGFSDDRRDWYTSAEAHNIVTVNGFASRDISTQENLGPEQRVFLDGAVFDVAEMQAPNNGVLGGAVVTRGVAFLDDAITVVYDHVEATQNADIRVQLHGRGQPARTGNQITWTAEADEFGDGGALHAAFVADGPLAFDNLAGWTSFYFSREETQTGIAARRTAPTATVLHTLVTGPTASIAPTVTDRTAGDLVSAELATATGALHLATQRDNAVRTADRIMTDATFASVGRDDTRATRWGVVRATTLAWDGLTLFESDVAVTATGDFRNASRPTVHVGGFDGTAAVTIQLLPTTTNLMSATFDGQSISAESLGAGRYRFSIAAPGPLALVTDGTTDSEERGEANLFRLDVSPNPSRGPVRFTLDVPAPGPVRVTVSDALGRQVATLVRTLSSGRQSLVLDQADLAPGVYTALVEIADRRARTRFTRLR